MSDEAPRTLQYVLDPPVGNKIAEDDGTSGKLVDMSNMLLMALFEEGLESFCGICISKSGDGSNVKAEELWQVMLNEELFPCSC